MHQSFKEAALSFRRNAAGQLDDDRQRIKTSSLRFSLRQSRASDPGDTLSTARSLGTLPGKRRIKETVSRKDKDVYQFSLSDLTDLQITFRNRSKANLFGEILDSEGKVFTFKGNRLTTKIKSGESLENFYEELPSGIYFLRIRSRGSGKNTYQLKLSASNVFPSAPDCGCGS